jgi:hypothetical protein
MPMEEQYTSLISLFETFASVSFRLVRHAQISCFNWKPFSFQQNAEKQKKEKQEAEGKMTS